MLSRTITVSNYLGLHARAAAQLVKLASSFRSKIGLARPDLDIFADAKSILSVLTLAASSGTNLEISIDGDDEDIAMEAIEHLFSTGFGEDPTE